MKKEYTISAFAENKSGLLTRVVSIFTRRHINIESLNTSKSSIDDIHRFTIVVELTEEKVKKLVQQIEKQVDVLKAFYYENSDLVFQELALYKVPREAFFGSEITERIVRKHNARILVIESDYVVVEKTGHQVETESLFNDLKEIGIYEFVRSGRVAIVKPMEQLNQYLKTIETVNSK